LTKCRFNHRASGNGWRGDFALAVRIKRFAQFYGGEKEVWGQPPDVRVKTRQSESKAMFDDLEPLLHAQLPKIFGKSLLVGAVCYGLIRTKMLRAWLDHGFQELDKDAAERFVRPIAPGRVANYKITKFDERLRWRYPKPSVGQHHPPCSRMVTPNANGTRCIIRLSL
jgi:hypothetical protein